MKWEESGVTGHVGKRWRVVAVVQGLAFSLKKPTVEHSDRSIME